jgi:hypothetical protein
LVAVKLIAPSGYAVPRLRNWQCTLSSICLDREHRRGVEAERANEFRRFVRVFVMYSANWREQIRLNWIRPLMAADCSPAFGNS